MKFLQTLDYLPCLPLLQTEWMYLGVFTYFTPSASLLSWLYVLMDQMSLSRLTVQTSTSVEMCHVGSDGLETDFRVLLPILLSRICVLSVLCGSCSESVEEDLQGQIFTGSIM